MFSHSYCSYIEIIPFIYLKMDQASKQASMQAYKHIKMLQQMNNNPAEDMWWQEDIHGPKLY